MPQYDDSSFSPPAPVAKVTLRTPGSNSSFIDVLMLIDSGADVTLLPQTSIDSLGLESNEEEVYELEGFDGSTSISRAVHVDLVFSHKTFKGRFLLINQTWGILGRDVLNHVSLILDGPQQTWEVH